MAWSKLDDQLHANPKIGALSDKAFRVYILSITYSSSRRTQGRLSELEARSVLRLADTPEDTREAITQELVELHAWDCDGDDYLIHDYQVYNPPPPDPGPGLFKQLRREAARFRDIVLGRDGHKCVTCGVETDLTIDHIVPLIRGGTNSLSNFQTLCRPCNSRKGGR